MNKLIFDIGMHTGKDTLFYLKKGFKVVSVEANSDLIEKAKIKFSEEISNGLLTLVDKAISVDSDSEITFYVNKDKDDWGTIDPDWNRSMNNNYISKTVSTINLEDLIKKFGVPYYIKIDIEGADVLCLKSLLNIKEIPEYLSVELLTPNNLSSKKVNALEIISYLYVLGYRKFSIVDQSKNHTRSVPFPPKEGEYFDCVFDGESSGLFGKELNEPIYSLDEISRLYLDYFYPKKQVVNNKWYDRFFSKEKEIKENVIFHENGWFDIHASK
jgi:FkbM family methyltransferase